MVNVIELKRNNYLFQKSRGIAVQIDNPRGLHQITAWGVDWPIGDFENIPLTPDWLKRCGFYIWYQTVFTEDHSGISVYLELSKGLFQPVITGPDGWIEFGKPLQYLHQLQNLYFDLTGEELNIPLNMIKANEIKKGNKIFLAGIDYEQGGNKFNDPDGDEVIDVDIDILKELIAKPFNYKPIPLTPEWLAKFGFEVRLFKDESGALIRIRMHPLFIGALFKKSDYFEFQTGPEPTIIKYVHELQNYYRDSTGEELTIKDAI